LKVGPILAAILPTMDLTAFPALLVSVGAHRLRRIGLPVPERDFMRELGEEILREGEC
jgi:hypothetical protein